MLGRATGVCGGRAGSMNVIDLEHGLVGCYGIVGGSIAAALGAGLSAKRQGRVSVSFFGDGAANQAYFHECLNMAAVQRLPVVFVCENNLYAEFTPMADATAGADIAARANGYGLPSAVVDGNDLWAVHAAAAEAVDRARSGGGPTLLECKTYRHYGHSKSDPAPYRTKEEVERVVRARSAQARPRPAARGGPGRGADRRRRGRRRRRCVEHAIENALAAPYPDPDARRGHGVQRMSTLEFRVAIRDALAEELERDPSVVFFGEDVAVAGGVFKATPDLFKRFGPERVFDTPISELALAGAAYGAAVTGLRPVFEVMFGDFMALAMDSLVNQAAKFWYISKRAGHRAAGGALGRRRRRALRRDPLPDPRHLVPGHPGAEDRLPVLAGRGQGAAQGIDPGRQSGHLPGAQAAVLGQGATAGARAGDHPARPRRDRPLGR